MMLSATCKVLMLFDFHNRPPSFIKVNLSFCCDYLLCWDVGGVMVLTKLIIFDLDG